MHKQRLSIFILALIGIIGSFLPWIITPFLTVSGTDGSDGWITLVLYALPLVLVLLGNRSLSLKTGLFITIIILALLGSVTGFYDYSKMQDIPGNFASAGIGLYMVIASGVLIVISSIVFKGKKISTTEEIQ